MPAPPVPPSPAGSRHLLLRAVSAQFCPSERHASRGATLRGKQRWRGQTSSALRSCSCSWLPTCAAVGQRSVLPAPGPLPRSCFYVCQGRPGEAQDRAGGSLTLVRCPPGPAVARRHEAAAAACAGMGLPPAPLPSLHAGWGCSQASHTTHPFPAGGFPLPLPFFCFVPGNLPASTARPSGPPAALPVTAGRAHPRPAAALPPSLPALPTAAAAKVSLFPAAWSPLFLAPLDAMAVVSAPGCSCSSLRLCSKRTCSSVQRVAPDCTARAPTCGPLILLQSPVWRHCPGHNRLPLPGPHPGSDLRTQHEQRPGEGRAPAGVWAAWRHEQVAQLQPQEHRPASMTQQMHLAGISIGRQPVPPPCCCMFVRRRLGRPAGPAGKHTRNQALKPAGECRHP